MKLTWHHGGKRPALLTDDQFAKWKSGVRVRGSSHFDPERGCVVPTSRSTPSQHQVVQRIRALRPALCTQPRAAK